MNRQMLKQLSVGALVAGAVGAVVVAGDLTPPPGPVDPTMKTLEQIEPRTPISLLPFVITQPGSYYLTGNLATESHGILVNAPDVTIDMMGFAITGPNTTDFTGIRVDLVPGGNFTLSNGTIRNFARGVYCIDDVGTGGGSTIVGVRIENIGETGVHLVSRTNLIRDCYVESVAGIPSAPTGISVASGVIENCRVFGCGVGYVASDGSVLHNSVARQCGIGAVAISSLVRGCAFFGNTQSLHLSDGSLNIDNYAP